MSNTLSARLNITAVNGLLPGETLRDTEIKGFGVRRRSGAPSYFLQTRIKGRLRWMTIGVHGSPWTPASARKEALRLLSEINGGADPGEAKRAGLRAPIFAEAADQFLQDHGPKLKPRTIEEYQRHIAKSLIPAFGQRLMSDLTRADIASFHTGLAKTPRKANLALAVLSKIISWSELRGLRTENTNPCRGIKRFAENQRQRFLLDEEILTLGDVLRDLETRGEEAPHVIATIRLLLLTGCRVGEILSLKWQYVDLQRGLLFLPDSKTGQKSIFLNDDAKEIIAAIPRLPDNPYLIVGALPGARLVNLQKPWRRIRKLAGIEDVRLHDLRHSFASVAAANGASLPLIGKLLGHSQPSTTQRYAHLVADPVRELNDSVGAKLGSALRGNKQNSG